MVRKFFYTILILGVLAISGHAQINSADSLFTVEQFLNMERVSNPQLSPEGNQIIYTRSHINKMEDDWESELWIMNADGSKKRFLTKGSSAQWSPDGGRIAYLASGESAGTQIFVRWMDAEGATSQITRLEQTPSSINWSPNGEHVAFTMLVPDKNQWSIDMPAPPEGADWTSTPRLVTETHYRQDRQGFQKQGFTHLFVVDADGGTPKELTSGKWNVGFRFSGIGSGAGIDWMPDGKHIVFDGLKAENPDKDGYVQSYIYAVNVESRDITQITKEKGLWNSPVVSPDGKKIAYAGYPFTLQSYKTSELYTINPDGSGAVNVSGSLDRDVGQVNWSSDSNSIYFTVGNEGTQNILSTGAARANLKEVTSGNHMISLSSLQGNNAVASVSSYHDPGNIISVSLSDGKKTKLTSVNEDILANKKMGEVEEVWYTSTDNTRVQGWIVKPPSFDSSKEYPLILQIHGGPHAMYNVGFSYAYQNYAANGYVVLYTNPRGSTGYGTAFGNAIDKDYPSVDHEDLMAGVDEVMGRGYIDKDRQYITGCSGGGVLSSWAIGQTDRFAAAAVRCPVINWISFAGTADIVQWGYNRFDGYFWENPDEWLEHSPLMHVGNVKTPVLLMTGELDLRTPISQTEEYYAALKVLDVPTKMLRFHKEYHGTSSQPSNFMRTQLYIMDWFDTYKKEGDTVTEVKK